MGTLPLPGQPKYAAGPLPVGYAGGGAIDEETGNVGSPMGQSMGSNLTSALASVQSALSYGRKLHGIGGEQVSARMPAVPGTPSESGVRQQPMPGPLPPTKNPFGKRADASGAEAPPEQEVAEAPVQEAIPTDDDEEMA